jgi:ABC-type microcin C transport system permease subunit YejB
MRFRVNAKTKEEASFLDEVDKAYILTARAIGATHHFPTGS